MDGGAITHHFLRLSCEEALIVMEGDAVNEFSLGLGIENDFKAKHQAPHSREKAQRQAEA
jgi:hypothetical protein